MSLADNKENGSGIAKVSLGYLSALGKINGVSQNKIISVKVGKKKKKMNIGNGIWV